MRAVVEREVRLVVHAVQALHDGLLDLVDDLRALARDGVDAVDALVVDLDLELLRPAAVAAQPGPIGAEFDPSMPRHSMLRPVGDTVGYELDGAVATLTLNRPQRLNAIVPALIEDLEAALDRAEADDAVRAIRLRGAGRAFCAGYDIEWGARGDGGGRGRRRRGTRWPTTA